MTGVTLPKYKHKTHTAKYHLIIIMDKNISAVQYTSIVLWSSLPSSTTASAQNVLLYLLNAFIQTPLEDTESAVGRTFPLADIISPILVHFSPSFKVRIVMSQPGQWLARSEKEERQKNKKTLLSSSSRQLWLISHCIQCSEVILTYFPHVLLDSAPAFLCGKETWRSHAQSW